MCIYYMHNMRMSNKKETNIQQHIAQLRELEATHPEYADGASSSRNAGGTVKRQNSQHFSCDILGSNGERFRYVE
jgi:hypothetical protein